MPENFTPSDIERFWSRIDQSGGPDACWPFLVAGGRLPKRYGLFKLRGRSIGAHRVAFFLTHGYWPEPYGLHSCDNPPCCNPTHIFAGTPAENVRDMIAKGRRVLVCGEQHGNSKLTPETVRAIRAAVSLGELHHVVAVRYGVNQSTVTRITNRQKWRHLA